MSKWQKKTMKFAPDATWKARPGYNVFAADRGAVQFEFPKDWIMLPDADSIKFHDRRPPDDDCCLAVSYLRLAEIDWSGLPVSELVEVATSEDERPIYAKGPIHTAKQGKIDLAWRERRFIDPKEQRDALTRLCIARKGTVQALITMEIWADQRDIYAPVWDVVLDSLVLDRYIWDPRKGPAV